MNGVRWTMHNARYTPVLYKAFIVFVYASVAVDGSMVINSICTIHHPSSIILSSIILSCDHHAFDHHTIMAVTVTMIHTSCYQHRVLPNVRLFWRTSTEHETISERASQ